MAIPTVATWQKRTSSILADRKNPLILDIDTLLRAYHAPAKTDVQKQKLLILMLYYCTEWLVEKDGKKNSFRKPHVQSLITEIESELRSTSMVNATNRRIGGGGVNLKEDPIEMLQPRDVSTKLGLRAGLQFTRLSAAKADNFVSGFGQKKKLTGYLQDLQNAPVQDYVDSLKVLAAGNATDKLTGNLEYLSKTDRLRCQLSLWPDRLFHCGGADIPYSTPQHTDTGNNRIRDLFAMDEMQFIYVKPPAAKYGAFHHSSFLSGKSVLCAGEIIVDNGRITYISNESGHYKPSTQDLLKCVEVLQKKYGVDLRRMAVADMAKQKEWKLGWEFMARRGVPRQLGQ